MTMKNKLYSIIATFVASALGYPIFRIVACGASVVIFVDFFIRAFILHLLFMSLSFMLNSFLMKLSFNYNTRKNISYVFLIAADIAYTLYQAIFNRVTLGIIPLESFSFPWLSMSLFRYLMYLDICRSYFNIEKMRSNGV